MNIAAIVLVLLPLATLFDQARQIPGVLAPEALKRILDATALLYQQLDAGRSSMERIVAGSRGAVEGALAAETAEERQRLLARAASEVLHALASATEQGDAPGNAARGEAAGGGDVGGDALTEAKVAVYEAITAAIPESPPEDAETLLALALEPRPDDEILAAAVDRYEGLLARLHEDHPEVFTDQRHTQLGTPERAYWHHGYAIALGDLLRALGLVDEEPPPAKAEALETLANNEGPRLAVPTESAAPDAPPASTPHGAGGTR